MKEGGTKEGRIQELGKREEKEERKQRGSSEVPVNIPNLLYSVLPCLMITTTGSAPSFTAARGRVTLLPGDETEEEKGRGRKADKQAWMSRGMAV
jgi:hypothetical protein